jgi:hypothetical protein
MDAHNSVTRPSYGCPLATTGHPGDITGRSIYQNQIVDTALRTYCNDLLPVITPVEIGEVGSPIRQRPGIGSINIDDVHLTPPGALRRKGDGGANR